MFRTDSMEENMSIQLSPAVQRAWTDIQKILAAHGITASDATLLDAEGSVIAGWRVVEGNVYLQWVIEPGVFGPYIVSIATGDIAARTLSPHADVFFLGEEEGTPDWYIGVSPSAPNKPYGNFRAELQPHGDEYTGKKLDGYGEGLKWIRRLIEGFQEHTKV